MTIYVDDPIFKYRKTYKGHMISSASREELHQFAQSIGIKRCWFHANRRFPHYDISPEQRELAIRNGAVPVSSGKIISIMKGDLHEGIENQNKTIRTCH